MSDLTIQALPGRNVAVKSPASPLATQIVKASPVLPTVSGGEPIVPSQSQTEPASSIQKVVRDQAIPTGRTQAVSNSNILTYRDSETGKLIVRLVDHNNNSVIAQFPSPSQLSSYPKVGANFALNNVVDEEA